MRLCGKARACTRSALRAGGLHYLEAQCAKEGEVEFLVPQREKGMLVIECIVAVSSPRLDVYQCAVRFLAHGTVLAEHTPRGHAALGDQLRGAALSVPLYIAEGSGKGGRDAARFYTIARGSALECAAILDALEAVGTVAPADLMVPRELFERIVSMLTKLREA